MRIYMHGSEIPEFDLTPAIHEWFAAGVRRKRPDTVKPLNQDQAHKLTVELLEDEEGDIFSDMEDGSRPTCVLSIQ